MIFLDTITKEVGTNADGKRIVLASLLADTDTEVSAIGTATTSVQNMPSDMVLAPFSTAFTATKKLGVLNSSGTWDFS